MAVFSQRNGRNPLCWGHRRSEHEHLAIRAADEVVLTDSATGSSSTPAPASVWVSLGRDPIVRLGAIVSLVVALPYLVPLLSPTQLATYAERIPTIALLLCSIAAFRFRLLRIESSTERLFWNLWTAAFFVWLVAPTPEKTF